MQVDRDDLEDFERWLLQGKFEPQFSLVSQVRRPELLQRLDESLRGVLTLIVTPAGYGKSTLLSQWSEDLKESGRCVSWLATDENDREPHHFLSHLILSLSFSGVPMGALEKLANQGLVDVSADAAIKALVAVLQQQAEPLTMVIDDYHRAGSPQTDRAMEGLLEFLPEQAHVAVSSRSKPGFRYSALKINGLVQQFSVDDLRFSAGEARQIFPSCGDVKELATLMERTEGWAMALQMARSLMRDDAKLSDVVRSLTGSTGDIADYFAQQVYEDLPDDICRVLRRTSIVERFNADLANALSERIDCVDVLERLRQKHSLIISTGREPVWYRYHHLFAEFLRNTLERTEPEHLSGVHLKAAHWYNERDLPVHAIKHACLGGELEYAARIVEDAGGWELILLGGIPRLRQFIAHFPVAELARFPRLQVARVYQAIKEGQIPQAHRMFADLKETSAHLLADGTNATAPLRRDVTLIGMLLDAYEDRLVDRQSLADILAVDERLAPSDSIGHSIVYVTGAVAALAIGSFEEAFEYARISQRHFREVNCVLGLNYTLVHQGQASLFLGRLKEAIATLDEARDMAEDNFGADSGLKAIADILSATAHYLLDDHDRERLADAVAYAEHYDGWFDVYAAGYGTAASLAFVQHGLESALEVLASGRQVAENRNLKRLADLLDAHEYLLYARSGAIARARRLARQKKLELPAACVNRRLNHWRRDHLVGLAGGLVALAARDHTGALRAGETLADAAAACGNRWYALDAQLLRALALDAGGAEENALTVLIDALDLAVAECAYRPLLDFGKPLERLFARVYRRRRDLQIGSLTHRFIADCLARFKAGAFGEGASDPDSPLSPREQEVLEELSHGLSNKGIARALDMTENTVKFHLKNIFAKLDVSKRMMAVSVGRSLGLIP